MNKLQRLKDLCARAVAGPWLQSHRELPDGMYSTQVYTEDGETVCTMHWYQKPEIKGVIGTYREANAELIATFRNELPALLSLVEKLNEKLELAHDLLAQFHYDLENRPSQDMQEILQALELYKQWSEDNG